MIDPEDRRISYSRNVPEQLSVLLLRIRPAEKPNRPVGSGNLGSKGQRSKMIIKVAKRIRAEAEYRTRIALDRTRLEFARHRGKVPLLLYQHGKVASMSLVGGLLRARLARPIIHLHTLRGEAVEAQRESRRREAKLGIVRGAEVLSRTEFVRKELNRVPDQRWDVITLCRDPVDLDISRFFYKADRFMPDFRQEVLNGRMTVEEVRERFLSIDELRMDGACIWFERELEAFLGFDVHAQPFPREAGYDVRIEGRARVLTIRYENLDNAPQAMRDFLDLEDFRLAKDNRASDGPYRDLNRQFKLGIQLPADYLDRKYSSRYARHFYSEDEIARARARWE